ncbi:MAG: PAS domain S-box protein, partial [Deltaproteobacteria bacterium]|nr:PAS domain S-box protein [Deltaproteobacteria bacterium]
IPLFHYALKQEGILFLGSSESVGRHQELFRVVSKPHNIYRKKNHAFRPQLRFPTGARKLEQHGGPAPAEEGAMKGPTGVARAAEKVILEEHTPACVVVSSKGEVLHFHGRTGKYLEPASGAPTLQVADMAREGLRFAVLSAIRRAREKNIEVREHDVRVKTNRGSQRIDLVVRPFSEPPIKNGQLIVFQELPDPPGPEGDEEAVRNVIEGVVLTFINIDAQKQAQKELQEMTERILASARRFAESIVDTVRECLIVLDEEMRVVTANRSFYRTFGTASNEVEGRNLFELEGGRWDLTELRSLLEKTLEQDRTFEGFRLEHEFSRVGFKRLVLNARALRDDQVEERRILLAMEDRTGDEQADEPEKTS